MATAATTSVDEPAKDEMEELLSIFVDANCLRKSVITDIVGATSEHQAALFLEGLLSVLLGLRIRCFSEKWRPQARNRTLQSLVLLLLSAIPSFSGESLPMDCETRRRRN